MLCHHISQEGHAISYTAQPPKNRFEAAGGHSPDPPKTLLLSVAIGIPA
jgi:hypothetical protein